MKKLIFIISVLLITAAVILFSTSMNGETKNIAPLNLNDSDDVEIIINVDSIIKKVLDKDVFIAIDTMDFEFSELENINIHLDSLDFDGLENLGVNLDSIDIKLDNLDIEIEKLMDSLDVKKIIIRVKGDEMDSLKCRMKKLKIELSEKFSTMKDSMKFKMHKMKEEIKKDIKINHLQKYKDYKNMSDEEIIESLKENGIIENENEIDIKREDGKVKIKITKEKVY
ncbi:MAG: hypothetical protein JW917_08580 [Ignavibacteria bacterium]|nr:hypothetical protein [Ignavibacteria bacterium]